MSISKQNRILLALSTVFIAVYFIPWESQRVSKAVLEGFYLLGNYAREHVLLCLVPALFIAGAISVFLNKQAVMKYLGPKAPKPVAYAVASISGAILAVCSCTVLPLFKGIYKKGAGLGPAVSFLYSGPAISIIAMTLSFKVFGWKLGLARAIGALVFAIVIGLLMHTIFKKDDEKRLADERLFKGSITENEKPAWKTAIFIGSMVGFLIFINWASSQGSSPIWEALYKAKYILSAIFFIIFIASLRLWYTKEERSDWLIASRDFALQILPLLFTGVLISGFLLGRSDSEALIPNEWIAVLVGGNSIFANLIAASSGALMYFATLTEVPIIQGLLGSGMGNGPALALLLAGPSLSLPSILVIGSELGVKKTAVYIGLVISLSTLAGYMFGHWV